MRLLSACKAPPLKVRAPDAAPRLVSDEMASVPPLMRPRRDGGRRARQRPGAAAGLLEDSEAAILRAWADLGDVETAAGRAAQSQRVGGAGGHHVADDGRPGMEFEHIGAAGKGDGMGARAVAAQPADDRAAIDKGQSRARDADAARARRAPEGAKSVTACRAAVAADDRADVVERRPRGGELQAGAAVAAAAGDEDQVLSGPAPSAVAAGDKAEVAADAGIARDDGAIAAATTAAATAVEQGGVAAPPAVAADQGSDS